MDDRRYHIITFGCQMNEHDSETIAGLLNEKGLRSTDDALAADIVIINTCSVRENADKRFFGTLGQLKKQKAKNPEFIACVCGCMMQQEHIVSAIRRQYPWVDIVFGTHNIEEFPRLLEELDENRRRARGEEAAAAGRAGAAGPGETAGQEEAAGAEQIGDAMSRLDYTRAKHEIRSARGTRIIRVLDDRETITEGLPAERLFRHKAFVNIMFGCNNFCTYCIVPYTRGREKSRRPEDILREVRELVADGVMEVTLLGQNVNSYRGVSGEGRTWDFTDLIYALNEVEGLERIRFMTSHPKDLSERLIVAFAECEKLCRYIHLPVQAGSSRLLAEMNRKYTREEYLDLVRRLREQVPEITISTDVIVGFPGETEEDFEEMLSLAREVEYDSAFTFLYSKRKGTPAAEYPDQIPEEVKHERFDRLVQVMNEISLRKNAAYVGRVERVLVDGVSRKDPGVLNGRTDGFKLVDFAGDPGLIGRIVPVRITEGKTFSLKGELL